MTVNLIPLRECVRALTELANRSGAEPRAMITGGRPILARLIASDEWLPAFAAEPDTKFYRQYLLHCDALERFSIVSFVWGPGQQTPIHDHTVWGLVGMLRGKEYARRFELQAGRLVETGSEQLLPGEIDSVSPDHGDIHQVSNAFADRVSISIHIYGGNIGRVSRKVYDIETGHSRPFVSGYANSYLPNMWNIT